MSEGTNFIISGEVKLDPSSKKKRMMPKEQASRGGDTAVTVELVVFQCYSCAHG
jgi:hypothetical protein